MTSHLVITGVCSAERRRFARLAAVTAPRRGVRVADLPADADPALVHTTLDTTDSVCIVDARHGIEDLRDISPLRRRTVAGDVRGDDGARARQAAVLIESASAVVIVNWERVPTPDLSILMALASHLAPTARVRLSRGPGDDLAALLPLRGTAPTAERPGWTHALNDEHDPFLTDRRVLTIRYTQLRPFHPARLLAALDRIEAGAAGLVLRSVGICRLATRPGIPARWEQAGSAMWIDPLGDGHGCDDVGQDIALTGIDVNAGAVRRLLDDAALSDAELDAGPTAWRAFEDPLPAWRLPADPRR